MIVLLALAACTNDFSNAIFADDAGFLDALPTAEHLYLTYPSPETGIADDDELADLYGLTVGTLQIGGSVLELATDATEQILTLPPSERGEDYRVWGPLPYDPSPDYFLRVEMTRSSTGATYTYAFQLAETSAGVWWEFLEGAHGAGDEEVALGEGFVTYRDLTSEAAVHISYDLREGREISAVVEQLDLGDGPVDQEWTWTEADDGGASLAFTQPVDGDIGERGTSADTLELDSRWDSEGAGRGEALISGGDLGDEGWELLQCWDAAGATTWSWDSLGWIEQTGQDSACVLE